MDTTEHTEVGDALCFDDWDVLKHNPYLKIDNKGHLQITMQAIGHNGLPEPLDLRLSTGNIVAMSGDYYGGREVDYKLPSLKEFSDKPDDYELEECETLGAYLVKKPITADEEKKFINSYKQLANKDTEQDEIKAIYEIDSAKYISFSETLNFYLQQAMFAIYVKNYGEILNRNLSHFTPWSVRAYTLGHSIALKFARLHYDVMQLKHNIRYQSPNPDFKKIQHLILDHDLQDLAYRYQALALGMECFCFHYYSDHYAAGHQSMVGDLRDLLPKRFGYLGGILVNNIHDELNAVTVYTRRPYGDMQDPTEPPLEAGGDGDFDSPKNYFNKRACIEGMQCSLKDLKHVFQGKAIPKQEQYGGLNNMPDIDEKYRQPQPLIVLGKNNTIYRRSDLQKIEILSPSELRATYEDPLKHGYTELNGFWSALILVIKLRVLSFIYQGSLQPLSAERLAFIEKEEKQLNPGRQPIPTVPVYARPSSAFTPWQKPVSNKDMVHAAEKHGLLANTADKDGFVEIPLELSNTL